MCDVNRVNEVKKFFWNFLEKNKKNFMKIVSVHFWHLNVSSERVTVQQIKMGVFHIVFLDFYL